jgi:putative transcriptional regulator
MRRRTGSAIAMRHKTDERSLRERVERTQSAFARMIDVSVRTLQNWEQGRRDPDGPAKAVLAALHSV